MPDKPQESTKHPYGWLAFCLRWPSLLAFAIFDIALLAIVVSLTIVSSRGNGFVTVPTNATANRRDPDIFDIPWDLGVLWTSLPSFVFTLFGAYWAWIASSLADRQPYVELRKEGGSDARRTVLLDYRVVAAPFRWFGAFHKSHFTVGTTTLLSLVLTYFIAPLAARLFAAQPVATPQTVPILYNQTYDDDNFNSTVDWRPVFNVVAATLLYGGKNIPWTNGERAFRPFAAESATLMTTAKMEANTTAYSGYLNCELVKDYTITPGGSGKSVDVSGTDRGCSFKQNFLVADTQEIYMKSTGEFACSAEAYYSRFVFTSARYSASATNNLDDVSVISCATGYRAVSGILRVSPSTGPPTADSFVETGERNTTRPKLWRVFEQGIIGPVTFNPTAKWSTTEMANLILYYAERTDPSNFLDPEILMKAIPLVFMAIYSNAVAIHGFDTLSNEMTATGTAFVPATRLFVVPWVAYVILAFLGIALGTVIFVFFRLRDAKSILTEEPQGLLSMAAILDRSELLQVASRMRREDGFDGGVWKRGKDRPEVKERKWRAAMNPETGNWVVRAVRDDRPEWLESSPVDQVPVGKQVDERVRLVSD